LPETIVIGLYIYIFVAESIFFIPIFVKRSDRNSLRMCLEIECTLQGHPNPRSLIVAPIESAHRTSIVPIGPQ